MRRLALPLLLLVAWGVPLRAQTFVRGDSNSDGQVDIGDALVILNRLFLGQPGGVHCANAANAEASNGLNIADAIRILGFLYQGLKPPDGPPVGGFGGHYRAEHCGPLNPGDVDLGCERQSPLCSGI